MQDIFEMFPLGKKKNIMSFAKKHSFPCFYRYKYYHGVSTTDHFVILHIICETHLFVLRKTLWEISTFSLNFCIYFLEET